MNRYTIPVGENGRIILPRELRRALGVGKGSRVVIEARDDRLELTTADRLRREAQERYQRLFPGQGRHAVDDFLVEKREEVRREGDYEPGSGTLAPDDGDEHDKAAPASDAPE